MTKVASVGAVVLLLAVTLGSQTPPMTDFSGRWQLDKGKSANVPPDMERAQAVTAFVEQKPHQFTVQYQLETPGAPTGDYSVQTLTYRFGTPAARWLEGDKELELIFESSSPSMTRKERWHLAGDVLTIHATIERPQAKEELTLTFLKAPPK